jgi:hypothetical protein
MTDTKPTIELPRLENESARAYQARTEYILAGPNRDLRSLAQRLDKSLTIVGRWSSQYEWVKRAAEYDRMVADIAARAQSEQYLADLEAHRKRAADSAHGLYTVSAQLIKAMNQALANPRKIKGEDGKTYTLHGIELNASAYSAAVRGMQTALDIEAHALGLSELMPKLANDDSE